MSIPIIAIDARSIGRDHTGDATYWAGLVRGLSELDSDLRYLLCSNAPAPAEIPKSDRFKWIEIPSHRERWWSLYRFPITARRMGASVIHTQYNLSPLVTRGGVTTVHDVSFYVQPEWFKPTDRVILQRFVPSSARRATRVITVSESSKTDIQKYISGLGDKVVVTPLAVNPNIHRLESDAATAIVESELGIKGPFILTVGTRWPRKNTQLAIDAAEALPDSVPHELVVTGKPGWGEERSGARTIFTGYVSDAQLSALYSCADLYIAPSRYEGFGLTLLEAFACGAPVIASKISAHEEIAQGAARVQDGWEPTEWATSIESLLADSSKLFAMRESGLKRAEQFSWKDCAQKTEAVYREIAR